VKKNVQIDFAIINKNNHLSIKKTDFFCVFIANLLRVSQKKVDL